MFNVKSEIHDLVRAEVHHVLSCHSCDTPVWTEMRKRLVDIWAQVCNNEMQSAILQYIDEEKK